MRLRDGKWRGLLPFAAFPAFRQMPQDDIAKVKSPESDQYSWPHFVPVIHKQTIESSHDRWCRLQQMRVTAFMLLVLMGIIFVCTHSHIGQQPWAGYVGAFAEAAMVGALADWFAVTALFRHPLGIPIPHTNVIQKRKDDLGKNLADFIRERFLTQENIDHRLEGVNLAEQLGNWLNDPKNAHKLSLSLCEAIAKFVDQEGAELTAFGNRQIGEILERADASALLARFLNLVVRNDHTATLIGRFIDYALDWYNEDGEKHLRSEAKKMAPWYLPRKGKVIDKLSDEIKEKVSDLRDDPDFRTEVNDLLKLWAWDLEHDPKTREDIGQFKRRLLNDREIKLAVSSLVAELMERLRRGLQAKGEEMPSSVAAVNKALRGFGQALSNDKDVSPMVDRRLMAAIRSLVNRYRDDLADSISNTVKGWDARETAELVELHIGRDLQVIRINGTLVGGLVGLIIHAASNAFL